MKADVFEMCLCHCCGLIIYRTVFQGDLLQLRFKLYSNFFGFLQLLLLQTHLLLLSGHLQQRFDLMGNVAFLKCRQ